MRLRVVPARTGTQWVREGLRLFFKQPLAFAGLFFMFMALSQVLSLVPIVGDFVGLALVPAFTVGMMAASRAVEAGRFPMPTLLISPFRESPAKTRAILLLGAMYALAVMGIMALASMSNDGKLAELLAANGGQVTPERMNDPALQEAMRASMRRTMLFFVMYLPSSVLFWHAPALVQWHGVPLVRSLFFSAVAVLRNLGAYVVYFMAWSMVAMLAALILLVVAGLLGNMGLATAGLMPIGLIVTSMVMASLWPTFRDSFEHDDAPLPSDAIA